MALANKLASTFIAATAAFLCAGAAYAGAPQWTLSDAKGDVTVLVAGEPRALAKGSPVEIGTAFVTGRNGSVVLTRGGQTVALSPNSRLRVADPAPSRGLVQMFTDEGTATFQVSDAAQNAGALSTGAQMFAVSTPYLAAAGRGAQFTVTVSDAGAQVKALDGAVQVITHDGRSVQRVSTGMVGLVSADQMDRLTIDGATPRLAGTFAPTTVAMKN